MSDQQYQQLWRQIEQAGGVDAYVHQQLQVNGFWVERKNTEKLSDRELKAYKNALKQEAEQKRKLKKAAWDIYRQNHIVHIGEYYYWNDFDGKDDFDIDEPEARVANNGLPPLYTPGQLAEMLNISVSKLRWLCYHRDAATRIHYHRFTIPKRNGDERAIWAPLPLLKQCQRLILRDIVEKLPVHGAAHGFLPGRSTFSNAREHSGADVIVKMDVKDFFPSVTFPRVKGLFRKAGYREQVAILLAALCTEAPREMVNHGGKDYFVALGPRCLPQGAPTSPALTNTLCLALDRRLTGYSAKQQWRYTRYADDLTFSCTALQDSQAINKLLGTVRSIVSAEGFAINKNKTRIYRKGNRQQITGLVVNGDAAPRVPRQLKRQIRAAIHNFLKTGVWRKGESLQTIRGYLAYIQLTDAELAQQLRNRLGE